MTECRSEKIRNLIITHLGNEELEKYDKTIDACKLGNALKDERTWAHLCSSYPNLKGVTCEEIESFTGKKLPEFFFTDKYINLITNMKTEDVKRPESVLPTVSKNDFIEIIKQNVDAKEFKKIQEDTIYMNRKETMQYIERHNKLVPRSLDVSKQFVEDYLRHVKVYDRDEAYEAFKNIGDQIEVDTPGILKDPSTIFVTTPRGGHEMLSIFAYANDISKKQIPSDIRFQHMTTGAPVSDQSYKQNPISSAKYIEKMGYKEDEKIPTDIYGQTWLYDKSMPVKNVFIIDDIIASGEQIHKTTISLEEMFPDATINSVTLCKRSDDVVSPALPQEIKKYYTDAETIGINSFKDRRLGGVVGKEYITCLFPHACPDGSSDKLMIELMGDERCSPEKRIARRDL